MAETNDISGIILAGGRSSRLGKDKVFEVIGKETLIERAVRQLAELDELDELIVVTSERVAPLLDAFRLRARIVKDVHIGQGPMGGLHAGLLAAGNDYSLVVACDLPFLNQDLLRYMIGLRRGYDMVVPRVSGMIEPLHAVYSKSCLPAIERRLNEGRSMVYSLLEGVRVRFVEQEEVEKFDPKRLSFFNINSTADIEKARAMARDLTYDVEGFHEGGD
ncbi:MAG TPA: molybdenum cofactor guanylyltransferase [Dehalococcoidia bacterium]|nr:molybdenum cofactor guanylyltransferase [Dehalococcoidia bacterium]